MVYGDTLSGLKGGFKMFDTWIEYLHPKLGCPVIAKIEDEEEIKLKGYIIVKKVVNMECIYNEA